MPSHAHAGQEPKQSELLRPSRNRGGTTKRWGFNERRRRSSCHWSRSSLLGSSPRSAPSPCDDDQGAARCPRSSFPTSSDAPATRGGAHAPTPTTRGYFCVSTIAKVFNVSIASLITEASAQKPNGALRNYRKNRKSQAFHARPRNQLAPDDENFGGFRLGTVGPGEEVSA